MSLTAARIIWEICGSPVVDTCIDVDETLCWLCSGRTSRAMPRSDWQGALFTGQNRVRAPESNWICEPCVHVCSRIAPVPGRPPGACDVCEGTTRVVKVPKKGKGSKSRVGEPCPKCEGTGTKPFGGNFRNYSHLWHDGHYANASKGEKPAILAFLRSPKTGPWFAAIADSGQKHTLPWTPVNPAGARRGRVLFEERELVIPAPEDDVWSIVDDMASLLTVGATKASIETGDYTPGEYARCADAILAFEAEHGSRHRGGVWFELALYLAQRDEEAAQARMAEEKESRKRAKEKRNAKAERARSVSTEGTHGGRAARSAPRSPANPEREHPAALGPNQRPDAGRGADVRERPGVGDEAVSRPPDRVTKPGQLSLF